MRRLLPDLHSTNHQFWIVTVLAQKSRMCKSGTTCYSLQFNHPPLQIKLKEVSAGLIEPFHSRNQRLCKFIGTKESFYIRKGSTFKGLVWGNNTAAVFFRDINMADVTSCENTLKTLLLCITLGTIPARSFRN